MSSPSRRDLLAAVAAIGVGNATFNRAVTAAAAQPKVEAVTEEMVKGAEWVAGITLTDAERNELTQLREATAKRKPSKERFRNGQSRNEMGRPSEQACKTALMTGAQAR